MPKRAPRSRPRHCLALWATALAAVFAPAISQAQQMCTSTEVTTVFGQWLAPGLTLKTGLTPVFTPPYEPTGIGFTPAALRFLIELKSATTTRWTLTIRDLDYRVLASVGPRDFQDPETHKPVPSRWTALLDKNAVIFNLDSDGPGEVDLRIDSALAYPPMVTDTLQFSTKIPNNADWQELYKRGSDREKQVGNVVGMLVGAVQVGASKKSWCCSGVLLSPTIFLTNWHCGGPSSLPDKSIWRGDVCANTLIDLAWDDGTLRRQYACKSVLLRNQPLDFVLLRLAPIIGAGSASGQAQPARFQLDGIKKTDDVFMVHHAQCQPKLVSNICKVSGTAHPAWRPSIGTSGETAMGSDPTPDFLHTCDTEPGASGAPIFNAEGKLVGLHHLGFESNDKKQCDGVNKAVKIGQILEVIERDDPSLAREIGIK